MLVRSLSLAACLTLVSGTALADPTHWMFEGGTLEHYAADPGNSGWREYDGIRPTVASEHLFSGLRMNGNGSTDDLDNNQLFAIRGDDYRGESDADGRGSRLILRGSAEVHEPWDSATWSIPTTFNFGFTFGSGELAVYNAETTFFAYDHDHNFVQGVGSGLGEPGLGSFEPGGHGVGFQFVDRFNGDAAEIHMIHWLVIVSFDWTGQQAEDVLSFTTPTDGISIRVVPAPAGAAVLGAALLAGLRRRR